MAACPQLPPSDQVAKQEADRWFAAVPLPPVPACTCRYGLYRVAGAPGPWITVRQPGIRRPELRTAAFRIDPRCEHHGELRRAVFFDATYDGPGPVYLEVLDADERAGR